MYPSLVKPLVNEVEIVSWETVEVIAKLASHGRQRLKGIVAY
jgi:hypothetical protein